MIRLLIPVGLLLYIAYAKGKPVKETPETPPGDICQALKGAQPKKDVEIQPYCPDETPAPAPTSTPGKKVEK